MSAENMESPQYHWPYPAYTTTNSSLPAQPKAQAVFRCQFRDNQDGALIPGLVVVVDGIPTNHYWILGAWVTSLQDFEEELALEWVDP